jgi:chromosome segregation ATPase
MTRLSNQPAQAGEQAGEQSIEQLQGRYQALHTRKIQAETNLQNAKERLDTLREEARVQFGTDDVAELRQKLDAMKAENEAKRSAYQADLDRIEADLAAVEQRFSATENPSADGDQA